MWLNFRKCFNLAKFLKMGDKSLPWASFLLVDSAQGGDLAPIFEDLRQSEKLSEIKPPLHRIKNIKVL